MTERRKGMLILLFVLAILLLVFSMFYDEETHYQWHEGYRSNSDQPYGTLFIEKMLETYRPGEEFTLGIKPLKNILKEVTPAETDYVFIGPDIFLDSESRRALIQFMNAGGDAFMSSLTLPDQVIDAVYEWRCDSFLVVRENRADFIKLNFFDDALQRDSGFHYAFRFMANDQPYHWNYFHERIFCDSTHAIVPLGYQEEGGYINFLKIPVGLGNLYLHSNPLVFTNYFLTQKEKVEYASGVFSHLDGKHIIWDEYSKIPFMGDNNAYNSPLYYILAQPSLKYAWWLLLLTVVLYVLFAARRKQRVIPVIEGKTNTSLEFVSLISRLHYKNGNHLDMAHKKMKYFLYFVRSKYGIHAEKFKEEHMQRLAEKSRVSFPEVEAIFLQYYLIEDRFKNNIEANRLVDLFDSIENFYKQCK